METTDVIEKGRAELEAGMQLAKCRKCGCMQGVLDTLAGVLPDLGIGEAQTLAAQVATWAREMEPLRYACLGCEYCYPAVAQGVLAAAFPSVNQAPGLSCDFQIVEEGWPRVVGDYFVVNRNAPVAVSTLASTQLAEALADRKPTGLAIAGKTETENIGIDKVIKNVITNPAIRYLIVAGKDPAGHQSGKTLLALSENGVDPKGRVIGSPGKRPVLRNVSTGEVEAFRNQVQVIDMIGCENPEEVDVRISELSQQVPAPCGCSECAEKSRPVSITQVPTLFAGEPGQPVKMDKAGYFVVVPLANKGLINVEHYAYDDVLLHVVEGETARALYTAIVANGWVTELTHAAYLGKELAKAELSIKHRLKYLQDGA